MAKYRVHATKDYTVMCNTHLRDKNMSLKAKGLLSLMLSLPPEWDYSLKGLCAICKENITSVKSTLNELKELGYLVVTKKYPNETETGRFRYEYDIYEIPKQEAEKQGIENLYVENLPLENLPIENRTQLNTKESNTKELSIEEINTKESMETAAQKSNKRFTPPTLEEVQQYCRERSSPVDPQQFFEYFSEGGWIDSKGNKVKNWKQKLITWEKYQSSSPQNQRGNKYKQTSAHYQDQRDDDYDDIFIDLEGYT